MWRHGCSKSPEWDSGVESWTESEGTLSFDFCEHNVESFALHVIGLNWSGEKVFFLEVWEVAMVVLGCHVALNVLCQESREA